MKEPVAEATRPVGFPHGRRRPGPQPAPSSLVTLPFIFLNSAHCFEFDFCFLVCGQPPPPPHGGHRGHRPDRDVCRLRPVRGEQADTRSARGRVCQPRQRPAGSERGLRLGAGPSTRGRPVSSKAEAILRPHRFPGHRSCPGPASDVHAGPGAAGGGRAGWLSPRPPPQLRARSSRLPRSRQRGRQLKSRWHRLQHQSGKCVRLCVCECVCVRDVKR